MDECKCTAQPGRTYLGPARTPRNPPAPVGHRPAERPWLDYVCVCVWCIGLITHVRTHYSLRCRTDRCTVHTRTQARHSDTICDARPVKMLAQDDIVVRPTRPIEDHTNTERAPRCCCRRCAPVSSALRFESNDYINHSLTHTRTHTLAHMQRAFWAHTNHRHRHHYLPTHHYHQPQPQPHHPTRAHPSELIRSKRIVQLHTSPPVG